MANTEQTGTLCENLSFAAAEAYKRLRTNVLFSFTDGASSHIIGMTSAQMSDGKSTTAVNFAYSLAELGKKVLLIDADMRRPSLHEKLGFEQTPGLSNLMTGTNNVSAAMRKYQSSTGETSFTLMVAGDVPPNPSELLNSQRMKNLLTKLREVYDFIILDLPPVGAVADAQMVSALTDGMIIVVRENNCMREALDDCVNQLRLAQAHILGFVVNGSTQGSKGYGKYGHYGRYGSYSSYGYYK